MSRHEAAFNEPLYHSDTHAVIWRELHVDWPYLVVRLTDGVEGQFGDLRGALVWAEGVASVKELSKHARTVLRRFG